MTISRITEALKCDVLFCAVESRDHVSIPGGNQVIHDGDMVSILASPVNAAAFFKKIGLKTNQVKKRHYCRRRNHFLLPYKSPA